MKNLLIAQVIIYPRADGWHIGLRIGMYVCRWSHTYKDAQTALDDAVHMYGVPPVVLKDGDVIK